MFAYEKAVLLILSFVLVFTLAACSGSSGKDVTGGVKIEKVSDMKGTVRVALAGWQLDNGIDALTGNPTIGLNEYLDKTFKKCIRTSNWRFIKSPGRT